MFSISFYFMIGIMIWTCVSVIGSVINQNNFVNCNVEPCEYPKELIEMQDLEKYKDAFKDYNKFKRDTYPDSSFFVEQSLCKSKIQTINPRTLKALDGEMKTIVNHGMYRQEVRTEICENNNHPCSANIYPTTTETKCRQKHRTIKLVTYSNRKNCLIQEQFSMPSHCECFIDSTMLLSGFIKDLMTKGEESSFERKKIYF